MTTHKEISVLVVDDEKDILEALKTHLELDGYFVETAESGEIALEKLTARPFTIVLTDINMPQMDGVELLEKIKEVRGESLVIMITAYSTIMKVLNCRVHGAFDYLLKPFKNLEDIDDVLTRAVRQSHRWNTVLSETVEVKKQANSEQAAS